MNDSLKQMGTTLAHAVMAIVEDHARHRGCSVEQVIADIDAGLVTMIVRSQLGPFKVVSRKVLLEGRVRLALGVEAISVKQNAKELPAASSGTFSGQKGGFH